MNPIWLRILAGALLVSMVVLGLASTYRVGPAGDYANMTEVATMLEPGDVVQITGDICESFTLEKHGALGRPITISGVTCVEDGRMWRPRVTIPEDAPHGILCKGDWTVIEGLEITGARGTSFGTGSAIYQACDNLTVRNCYIHHNKQGILADFLESGSILIELCEFDSNGGITDNGDLMHSVFLNSTKTGARATVRFCYIHDAAYAELFKSRCYRNVLEYNWFENQYNSTARIIDTNKPERRGPGSDLYPMHTDIVGNVFLAGDSPGDKWSILSLGGEGNGALGTEGDFHIAHNLFLLNSRRTDPPVAVYVRGNVDHVKMHNNVFLNAVNSPFRCYRYNYSWDEPRTEAFRKRRGSGDPVLEGAGNWVSETAVDVPEALEKTLRGFSPGFLDFLSLSFRPRKDSPLAGAGMWPLPKGQIIDLVPEYEPQRGIPADLRPKHRRKAAPPSVGPFEVQE